MFGGGGGHCGGTAFCLPRLNSMSNEEETSLMPTIVVVEAVIEKPDVEMERIIS